MQRHFPVLLGRRLTQLLTGLVLFGVGIGLMVRARVGVPPWDVLSTGIAAQTGIPFGYVTVLVSVAVLILWIPIREKPGLGTVLNTIIVGLVAQVVYDAIPDSASLVVRIPEFLAGLMMLALATGLYIGAQFGAGPRDGLMTGLHRITGKPIWLVRTVLEVSVLLLGWLLGGDVGLGTLAFALTVGPLSEYPMRWFDLRKRILAEIDRRDHGAR